MTDLEQQLQTRLDKAVEVFKQKEAEIAELRATIESKDKAYQILQDTYNQVFTELNKLSEQHKMLNAKYEKRKEQIVELESQLSQADGDNENLSQELENQLKINVMSQQKKEKPNVQRKDAMPSNFTLQDFGTTFSI